MGAVRTADKTLQVIHKMTPDHQLRLFNFILLLLAKIQVLQDNRDFSSEEALWIMDEYFDLRQRFQVKTP